MPRAEVWVRTGTKIIRAGTIRAVGWSPHAEPVVLELVASGEKQTLTIRAQPDLPRYFVYNERAGKTGDDQREEAYQAAWERAGGLDEGLLRAIADAAKTSPGQWEIEPLASGTSAPE